MESRTLSRGIIYSIKDNKKIFLIIKAKKGYWQFPQGGIDNNENPVDALKREIFEETGLTNVNVYKNTHYYIEYQTKRKGKSIISKLNTYLVRAEYNKNIILSKEDGHTDFKWIEKDEIKNFLTKYPEQMIVFNKQIENLKLYQDL